MRKFISCKAKQLKDGNVINLALNQNEWVNQFEKLLNEIFNDLNPDVDSMLFVCVYWCGPIIGVLHAWRFTNHDNVSTTCVSYYTIKDMNYK